MRSWSWIEPLLIAASLAKSTIRHKPLTMWHGFRSTERTQLLHNCPSLLYERRPRPSGGIGRRAGFKIRCPQGRVGSSPTSATEAVARGANADTDFKAQLGPRVSGLGSRARASGHTCGSRASGRGSRAPGQMRTSRMDSRPEAHGPRSGVDTFDPRPEARGPRCRPRV